MDPQSFAGHRASLCALLRTGLLYVEGGKSESRPYSDTDIVFRQNSDFLYLTGCEMADCAALINLATAHLTLLVPRLGRSYALWCGKIEPKSEIKARLQVWLCVRPSLSLSVLCVGGGGSCVFVARRA
jgi:hypothetical protein